MGIRYALLLFFVKVQLFITNAYAMHNVSLREEEKIGEISLKLLTGDSVDKLQEGELRNRLCKAGFAHLVSSSDIVKRLTDQERISQQAVDCIETVLNDYCDRNPSMSVQMELYKPLLLKTIFQNQHDIMTALQQKGFLQEERVEALETVQEDGVFMYFFKEIVADIACAVFSLPCGFLR